MQAVLGALQKLFDLLPDLAGVFLAAVSLGVAFLGQDLKWFEKHPTVRWTLAIILAFIGIGGVVSNARQRSVENAGREALQRDVASLKDDLSAIQGKLDLNQKPVVGLDELFVWPNQKLAAGRKLSLQIGYVVAEGVAKNFKSTGQMFSLEGRQSVEQAKRAVIKFRHDSLGKLEYPGEDRLQGTGGQFTLEMTLNEQQILQLLAATRTIYVLGRVEWKNAAGADFHLDTCMWMNHPTAKLLNPEKLGWHECGI